MGGGISGYEIIAFLTTILQGLKKQLILLRLNRLHMRRFYLAAVVGVLMLGSPDLPAYAQGSVLVPQDYTAPPDNSSTPLQSAPLTGTSLPKLDPDETDTGLAPDASNLPMTPMSRETNPYNATQVLKFSSAEAASIPGDEVLPEKIDITLKDYMWGPRDINSVSQNLQIPADQVPNVCTLSLTGMLYSDSIQGSYIFDMGSTLSTVTVYYEGTPSSVSIFARAMCNAVNLPPNSGTVIQIGDKFTTMVAQTQCPPPPPHAKTLTYKYDGNEQGSCVYQ
jgi:hypothetical protein